MIACVRDRFGQGALVVQVCLMSVPLTHRHKHGTAFYGMLLFTLVGQPLKAEGALRCSWVPHGMLTDGAGPTGELVAMVSKVVFIGKTLLQRDGQTGASAGTLLGVIITASVNDAVT